ncbi:MAG: hypothetical protein ACLP1X_00250 [Polyangiaceae bacterium]
MRLLVGLLFVSASALSCATYEEDLARSQRAFDASEHERALAILRSLEPDMGRLGTSDRAHYAYLRGMTDYRIGYKVDARHWLGVSAAIEQQTPGSIPPDSVTRLNEALKEMNEAVYSSGIEALSNDVSSAKTKRSEEDEEGAHDTDAPPAKDKKVPAKKAAPSPDSTNE